MNRDINLKALEKPEDDIVQFEYELIDNTLTPTLHQTKDGSVDYANCKRIAATNEWDTYMCWNDNSLWQVHVYLARHKAGE